MISQQAKRVTVNVALLVSFAYLFCFVGFGAAYHQAEDPEPTPVSGLAFGMTPASDAPNGFFEVVLNPGETYSISAHVVNIGSVDVNLIAYAANAVNPANGGFAAEDPGVETLGATNWLTVDDADFTLTAGDSLLFPVFIEVPSDALPGQYVTSVVVSTSGPVPIEGVANLNQIVRSALPIVIVVPGPTQADFEIGEPVAYRFPEAVIVDVPVTNTGNILVKLSGSLTIRDAEGQVLAETTVELGSIYAGNTSSVQISAPPQVQSGDYSLDLDLTDQDSNVTASLDKVPLVIDEPAEASAITVRDFSVAANAEDIVFANVAITIANSGQQVPATNVTLEVMRDGEVFDSHPIATNQVLLAGENQYTSIYVPSSGEWESGTFTFRITIHAVDPTGGQQIELLNQDLDAEIIVP